MNFGGPVLKASSIIFGVAFLYNIDATKKFLNRVNEICSSNGPVDSNQLNQGLSSFLSGLRSFYKGNRTGCLQFIFSNTALYVSGAMYDGSTPSKIFGIASLGATLYTFLNLKNGFESSKPFAERTIKQGEQAFSSAANYLSNAWNNTFGQQR